jgi:hypothetical protein
LSKISDFHHLKLILLSKTQKGHFNSIKISQGKNKKICGDKIEDKLKAQSQRDSQGGQDPFDWQVIELGFRRSWHMCIKRCAPLGEVAHP